MGFRYGLRIRNIEAGSLYDYNNGVRNSYDCTKAMLTNSLFLDFLLDNGLNVHKEKSTRDVICMEFNYGSRSYEDEVDHLKKIMANTEKDEKISKKDKEVKIQKIKELIDFANANEDKYCKKTKQELRDLYYNEGVSVRYINKMNKNGEITEEEVIKYKMLYRTPGKAKKGSCMFINENLYDKSINFLRMGIRLPEKNSPIVEMGAYASLITSSIVGTIAIDPDEILVLNDVDSFLKTKVISVEIDDNKHCIAEEKDDYTLKNTLFDGQALIDESIFPDWAEGYILLRHHLCKKAAFKSRIQLFFKDYFGSDYETAVVTDMWGKEHYAKDIKMITTDNAMKWLKFDVSYEYWSERVRENGCKFGIVKTAHPSKLGNMQRMSYQMINSLDIDIMPEVVKDSVDYIEDLKKDDGVFIDYLKKNTNFSNDYDVLVALCDHNPDFVKSEYFRERKKAIIQTYVLNFQSGKIIQEADNLVIVGSPYAMLLHSANEDVEKDDTFSVEDDAIQCYTERFSDGEYLAEFRSPFNSKNNMGHLHNVYSDTMRRYFDFGKQIIAVNMIHTAFQDRNNGSDQDSDSIYTTNQRAIVAYAKKCYKEYPTIVNNIPKEKNSYDNTMQQHSDVDNNLAAAQLAIGESSNLAQLCLTYTYNFDDEKYKKYVCILSVLAQCAIDNAKRKFDVDLPMEIRSIKKDMNISENKYPEFWNSIKKGFNRRAEIIEKEIRDLVKSDVVPKRYEDDLDFILMDKEDQVRKLKEEYEIKNKINPDLVCPMNYLCNLNLSKFRLKGRSVPMDHFFIKHKIDASKRRQCKRVEELIEKYSLDLYNFNADDSSNNDNAENYLLLREDFDLLIEDIRSVNISGNYVGLMSWLIDRAFCISRGARQNSHVLKSKTDKNKSILIKTLYAVNSSTFIKCFKPK